MTSLVLAVLLSAAPEVGDRAPDAPAAEPRFDVQTAPLSTALAGAGAAASPVGGIYLPIIVTARVGPNWGLTAELAGAMITGSEELGPGWSVYASIGPTLFWNEQGVDGFFVTLKGAVQQLQPTKRAVQQRSCAGMFTCPLNAEADNSRTFLIGVDAGYTWRFRAVTLTALLGVSAGYHFNQSSSFTFALDATTTFGQGFAWSLNLNFLRLGYAF